LFSEICFVVVERLGGSVSAEHGLGQQKRESVTHSKTAAALQLMWQLKQCLDSNLILNPHKVYPAAYWPAA
jgi:FAD/FMN-containing dehydrogenase